MRMVIRVTGHCAASAEISSSSGGGLVGEKEVCDTRVEPFQLRRRVLERTMGNFGARATHARDKGRERELSQEIVQRRGRLEYESRDLLENRSGVRWLLSVVVGADNNIYFYQVIWVNFATTVDITDKENHQSCAARSSRWNFENSFLWSKDETIHPYLSPCPYLGVTFWCLHL